MTPIMIRQPATFKVMGETYRVIEIDDVGKCDDGDKAEFHLDHPQRILWMAPQSSPHRRGFVLLTAIELAWEEHIRHRDSQDRPRFVPAG